MSASARLSRTFPGVRALLPALVAAAFALPDAAAADTAPLASLDPLERAQALRTADRAPWPSAVRRSSGMPEPAGEGARSLGVQTLLVALADGKQERKAGARIVRVFQYDHLTRRARRVDIALPDRRTVRSVELHTHHLPLSRAEGQWAYGRAASRDPGPATGTGEPAVARWSAFVYEPSRPDDPCRLERCALLSLYGAGGTVLTEEPIVHFGDGRVRTHSSRSP